LVTSEADKPKVTRIVRGISNVEIAIETELKDILTSTGG
jgi:molybdopterin-binding protein